MSTLPLLAPISVDTEMGVARRFLHRPKLGSARQTDGNTGSVQIQFEAWGEWDADFAFLPFWMIGNNQEWGSRACYLGSVTMLGRRVSSRPLGLTSRLGQSNWKGRGSSYRLYVCAPSSLLSFGGVGTRSFVVDLLWRKEDGEGEQLTARGS